MALPLGAQPLSSQSVYPPIQSTLKDSTGTAATPATDSTVYPPIVIQHYRPLDQRGINMFEPPKDDTMPFTHFTLGLGAAFSTVFQGLEQSNTAQPNVVNNVNANQLVQIGHGFELPSANLYLNAQLARGIRVELTSYLASQHHNDTWVKDGYLLVDASPIDVSFLNSLMHYLTIRVGDFEVDYGDAHYRRSDGGDGLYNPLIGNYIMDAFTNEIGGEVYVRADDVIVMGGVTSGQNQGAITGPSKRSPSYIGKIGIDRHLSSDLRVRLTGSVYDNSQTTANTLYNGDRAGSRYYDIMDNTATSATDAWSAAIQPGFSSKVRAFVLNPFVKFQGLELFGNIEQATGRSASDSSDRTWHQNVGEVVYRFLHDKFYVAGRYNTAKGEFLGMPGDVSSDRTQIGGGWFILPTVLAKVEYMTQTYHDFPVTDIRNGGKVNGFVAEGTLAF
ncbi:MAG TPA: hypothetical protein VNU46_09450 [Gemmatimonadaceae bacterium]|nr:hypothetical protein [Gemmatimonadaceae bacterium]